jgi:hypothetical protein
MRNQDLKIPNVVRNAEGKRGSLPSPRLEGNEMEDHLGGVYVARLRSIPCGGHITGELIYRIRQCSYIGCAGHRAGIRVVAGTTAMTVEKTVGRCADGTLAKVIKAAGGKLGGTVVKSTKACKPMKK